MTPENQRTSSSVAVLDQPEAVTTPKTKLSYEEFIAQTSDGIWAEWVDGEVLFTTVANENLDVTFFLAALLRHFAKAHDLGRVFGEPFQMKTGLNLPGRSPDVFCRPRESRAP